MSESSSTDTSIAEPQARFSLGVLFVHGIGNQACGDTLVDCAGAIYRWLKEWCNGLYQGTLTVALLDTFLQDGASPASTRLVFRKGESIGDESWLLAESWWAQTFKTPTFREVAYWSVVIVPLAILMHMGPGLRNAMCLIQRGVDAPLPTQKIHDIFRGFSELARWTLVTPLLVLVGMAVQCLIAGLLVLAIFPIKALRDLVGAAQRVLASVVGDSFIFVTSPVQEAAIISKFQRDLRWLSKRCEKVVVVAHSQGAAVAYKGIERLDWDGHMPEQVKLLVTLGSGLRKLVDLEQALERPAPGREDTRGSWRSLNSRAWTVIALSLGVLGGLVSLFLSVTNPWVSALTIALCLPALSFWLGSIGVGRDEGPPPLSSVFWQDYYSSHDPVPNGALLGDFDHPYRRSFNTWRNAEDAAKVALQTQLTDMLAEGVAVIRRPKFYEVYNLGSVLLDHTAYWSNVDGFVSSVVRTLGRFTKIGIPLGTHDEEWLELAASRRRWRVRLLVRLRRVAMLGSLALVLFHQPLLTRLGGEVMARLSYLSFLPGWTQQAFTHYSFAGSLGGVCGMIGLYVLALWGWRRWENSDFRTFFARQPYKRWGGGLIFFAVTGAVLIAISAWFVVTALSEMLDNGWSLMTLVAASTTLALWICARAPGVGVKWAQAGTPVTGA